MTGKAVVTEPRGIVHDSESTSTRRLTFAVLAVGVVTFSFVQSLVVPVLGAHLRLGGEAAT
jgi:hypothetical protein